jgi:DNA-directed RNA polymerase subunit RPC12/RpoP
VARWRGDLPTRARSIDPWIGQIPLCPECGERVVPEKRTKRPLIYASRGSLMSAEIITARYANQPFCLICGKAFEQHSIEERIECIDAEDAKAAALPCPACEKPIGQHSPDEIRTCARKSREKSEKLIPPE